MCLQLLTSDKIEDKYPVGYGYKAVVLCLHADTNERGWSAWHYPSKYPRVFGKWYTTWWWFKPRLETAYDGKYPNGYHIWLDDEHISETYITAKVRVEYRGIVARGYEYSNAGEKIPTIVARKMRVVDILTLPDRLVEVALYHKSKYAGYKMQVVSDFMTYSP